MPHAARLSYRPDIDGIRAIAVLLVVVFHFHLVTGVESGFMGVDVFFVISGFLITSIIQRQLDAQTFRLGAFWIQRIRRLAPALTATTLLTLIAGWLWLMPVEFAKLAQQTIAAQLYFANIFYWRHINYFGLQAQDVYLLHTWSLAVEEQFYLLFPITLLAISKWARGRVGIVLSVLALISFGLDLAFVRVKPEATFYLMPTRAWELLAGSLLALQVVRLRGIRPLASAAVGLAGFVCLGIAVLAYREDIAFPGFFALLPVSAGVLLILSGSLGSSFATRFLSLEPLAYVGRISYPLYLVHWPVNVFATAALAAGYGWGWRLSMLLLSVALAATIYHGIEGPARRWLEQASARTVLRGYGAALAGAVAVSIVVLGTNGVPSRYPARVAQLASFELDTPPPLLECQYFGNAALQTKSLCRLGATNAAPHWLIYGDSHAWAASGGLDQWLRQTGQSALFMFVHSCPPVVGVYVFHAGSNCFFFNAAALQYLKEQPTITHVLLISTWREAQNAGLTDTPDRQLTSSESLKLFDRQFAVTVDELRRMGKSTYIWEPVPGARVSVPQAMARSELESTPLAIDFTRKEYLADFSFFFDSLRKKRQVVAGTFSPSRAVCGSGRCVSEIDGSPLYFDNAHLAYSQSWFWAEALARQMPGRATGTMQ